MILIDDRGHETNLIPSGRRIDGDPQFPVHHMLNMRERSLRVPVSEFNDWMQHNGIAMIQFFNANEDVRNRLVEAYTSKEMTEKQVVASLSDLSRDTTTMSNLSYGFRSISDCVAFKMRWL